MLLDVKWTKLPSKRKTWSMIYFIAFLALNIWAQIALGYAIYGKFYLLFTQLPVFFLFLILSHHSGIKIFFILLTAVFFSSPVMVMISILRSVINPPIGIYILCYLLMLVLIKRFFKQPFNYMLASADNLVFKIFAAVPVLYYLYSYLLTHYQFTDLKVDRMFFISNLPLLIVLLSYILLVEIFRVTSEKAKLKNAKELAIVQLNSAADRLEQLKKTEQQSLIYRHDLRHHLRYIHACITENKLQEASTYINETCSNVENMEMERYSENEPLNLILSSYVGKAKEKAVTMEIKVTAKDFGKFTIIDLCCLLGNVLENAIQSASKIQSVQSRYVKLRLYEKNDSLHLEVRNRYAVAPIFENGLPIAQEEHHGIGTKSILQVVEKYGGLCRFYTKGEEFIFQLLM